MTLMKLTKPYNLMEHRAARRLANQIPNVSFFNITKLIKNVGSRKIELSLEPNKIKQVISSKIIGTPIHLTSYLVQNSVTVCSPLFKHSFSSHFYYTHRIIARLNSVL